MSKRKQVSSAGREAHLENQLLCVLCCNQSPQVGTDFYTKFFSFQTNTLLLMENPKNATKSFILPLESVGIRSLTKMKGLGIVPL